MVISLKRHFAAEMRSLDYYANNFDEHDRYAEKIIRRLKLEKSKKLLEIGSAQGSLLISLSKRGYHCEGIEPSDFALDTAQKLSLLMGQSIKIKKGSAEDIPYEDASFDMVIALSVMEHVHDIEKSFNEISRVLKPGGVFYFDTASSMCPMQDEIQYFPFFSWYPQSAKLKIINWAMKNKPALVGCTNSPAINWFTPWSAKRLLAKAGMQLKHDRWDLLDVGEFHGAKSMALRIIKMNKFSKFVGNVLTPGCAYLAIRNSS